MKTEHAEDDAIVDDTAGQAYVEQFAQQTFDRGEKVLRADKVTRYAPPPPRGSTFLSLPEHLNIRTYLTAGQPRQTADTFDAAAAFFQLTSVWGPPDEETQKKIKFAKWNAARILRAIKEGRDPNESNPKQDEEVPDDEGVPDEEAPQRSAAEQSKGTESPHLPPPPKHASAFTPPSPVSQASPHPADHVPSPYSRVSGSPAQPSQPHSPPPGATDPFASPPIPPRHSLHFPEATAADAYTPPPIELQPTFPGPSVMAAPGPGQVSGKAPTSAPTSSPWPQTNPSLAASMHGFGQQYPQSQSPANVPPTSSGQHHQQQQGRVQAQAASVAQQVGGYGSGPADDVNVAKAEKHAKWAISALNFDDVPTAIKELRNALETLGAK